MLGFGAAVSTALDHQQALDEVVPAAVEQAGGQPNLVVCFFSMHHAQAAPGIALGLSERTGTSSIIACTAEGVIAAGRELEEGPALVVWAAFLPGVSVETFALDLVELSGGYGVAGWPDIEPAARPDVLLLADPFSFPADSFVRRLNEEQPRVRLIGGMASGGSSPEQHRLLLGVQMGRVIDEHKMSFERGDFLIRSLIGVDEENGTIAISDRVELGQTLQFHVRDAAAASEDLELLLAPVAGWDPRGTLLFSCNGRGRRLFSEPDHDATRVAKATAAAPLAGFFAQGELGPIGGQNFLHGFTASVAMFCERPLGGAALGTGPADPVP